MDIPQSNLEELFRHEMHALERLKEQQLADVKTTTRRLKQGANILVALSEFLQRTGVKAVPEYAGKDRLIAIVEELLSARGPLPVDELKRLTRRHLKASGVSTAGIGPSFQAALASLRFTQGLDGVVSKAESPSRP